MAIKYDQYGNPLPPTMWDQDQPMNVGGLGGESGGYGYGNPQDSSADIQDYTPPTPMTPQSFLENNYNIKTTGPKADQAAQAAQDYRSNQSESFDRLGQNMPQKFGQAETTDYSSSPDEGPISPQETAERMPSEPDAMTKLINQHMLPSLPKASKDGYQNYVTASREKRAAEKDQLRQQGALNRADAASKDARAMDQTLQLSGLQGGGQTSFGGQNGPQVYKVGGYTFVGGHWRPQDTNEAAHTNLQNAQADYMRMRPEIAQQGYDVRREIADQGNQTKQDSLTMKQLIDQARRGDRMAIEQLRQAGMTDRQLASFEFKGNEGDLNRGLKQQLAENAEQGRNDRFGQAMGFNQQKQDDLNKYRDSRLAIQKQIAGQAAHAIASKDEAAANEAGEAAMSGLMSAVAELQAREGGAQKDDSWSVTKMLGLGKNPQDLKDRMFDKNGKPGNSLKGSFGVKADEAIHYADILADLHNETNYHANVSPEIVKYLEKLRSERGMAAPQAAQGAQ